MWNLEESLGSTICMKEFIAMYESHEVAPFGLDVMFVLFIEMEVTDPGVELLSVAKVSSEFALDAIR